jgi:hypothetical protein
MKTTAAKRTRIVAGFLVAPIIVPLSYFLSALVSEKGRSSVSEALEYLSTFGTYAYILAVVLGVPAFWLLRRRTRTGRSCGLIAGAIGLIGSGLMTIIGMNVEGVIIGGLAGLFAGIVFYLVAGAG